MMPIAFYPYLLDLVNPHRVSLKRLLSPLYSTASQDEFILRFGSKEDDEDEYQKTQLELFEQGLRKDLSSQHMQNLLNGTPNQAMMPTAPTYKGKSRVGLDGRSPNGMLPGAGNGEPTEHEDATWAKGRSQSELLEILMNVLGLPNMNRKTEPFEAHVPRRLPGNPEPVGHPRHMDKLATGKQALKRIMVVGGDPSAIEIQPEDIRYHGIQFVPDQDLRGEALIIYAMDYSGSMSEYIDRVKDITYWVSKVIRYKHGLHRAAQEGVAYNERSHYGQGVKETFLLQDDLPKETDREGFFNASSNGGTNISSVYKGVEYMLGLDSARGYNFKDGIHTRINPNITNIYIVHFSDYETNDTDHQAMVDSLRRLFGPQAKVNLSVFVHMRKTTEPPVIPKMKDLYRSHLNRENNHPFRYAQMRDDSFGEMSNVLRTIFLDNPKELDALEAQQFGEILSGSTSKKKK